MSPIVSHPITLSPTPILSGSKFTWNMAMFLEVTHDNHIVLEVVRRAHWEQNGQGYRSSKTFVHSTAFFGRNSSSFIRQAWKCFSTFNGLKCYDYCTICGMLLDNVWKHFCLFFVMLIIVAILIRQNHQNIRGYRIFVSFFHVFNMWKVEKFTCTVSLPFFMPKRCSART